MKKKYIKPSINVDVFQANEYIAACYSGRCNVEVENSIGSGNVMYEELNEESGYQSGYQSGDQLGDKRIWTTNTPCGAEFNVKAEGIKKYQWDSNGTWKGGTIKDVYYWSDGRTTHVSDQIEPASSSH